MMSDVTTFHITFFVTVLHVPSSLGLENLHFLKFKYDLRVETVAMRWLIAQRMAVYCQQNVEGLISDTTRVTVKKWR